jgi:hypothetical protein
MSYLSALLGGKQVSTPDWLSYRLCFSCRPSSYLRHLYPCLCLGVRWEAAREPSVEVRPRAVAAAGRDAPRQAAVGAAYSGSPQALLAAPEIFARVFAHSSAVESFQIEEARFDAAQLASAPFASALRYRPPRADCSKVAHFSSIHEDHFPGRSYLSADPRPVKHRRRLDLDDRSFPVSSRCAQSPPDREWRGAFSALRQHWAPQSAGVVGGFCPPLQR